MVQNNKLAGRMGIIGRCAIWMYAIVYWFLPPYCKTGRTKRGSCLQIVPPQGRVPIKWSMSSGYKTSARWQNRVQIDCRRPKTDWFTWQSSRLHAGELTTCSLSSTLASHCMALLYFHIKNICYPGSQRVRHILKPSHRDNPLQLESILYLR